MRLPRFYPIFDSADWIARALPLGVRLVQLRIKDRPEDTLRDQIARARALCRSHGAILVVNDHWRLAMDLGCGFVHLGQEDLDSALACAPDYVALGPVWPTILKPMKWHQQGVESLTERKARTRGIPLCAIGGLTPDRARLAFAAGADMAAAVTDITLNPYPKGRIREWLEAAA